jgi:hypothetical protein
MPVSGMYALRCRTWHSPPPVLRMPCFPLRCSWTNASHLEHSGRELLPCDSHSNRKPNVNPLVQVYFQIRLYSQSELSPFLRYLLHRRSNYRICVDIIWTVLWGNIESRAGSSWARARRQPPPLLFCLLYQRLRRCALGFARLAQRSTYPHRLASGCPRRSARRPSGAVRAGLGGRR